MRSLVPEIELLRRQYLQHLNLNSLTLPEPKILKQPTIQSQIYESMFWEDALPYPPPEQYVSRVLKRIVTALEEAMEDPEEDEISDALTAALAHSLSQPSSAASLSSNDLVPRKTHITYSAPTRLSQSSYSYTTSPSIPAPPPSPSPPPPPITILEFPSLLSAFSTTGHRTWPAALFLSSFLFSQQFPSDHNLNPSNHLTSSNPSPVSSSSSRPSPFRPLIKIQGKSIIELGAGTGLVSLCCAHWLGARYVLATDGTGEVIEQLGENIFLNEYRDGREGMGTGTGTGKGRVEAKVMKWGHALSRELLKLKDEDEDEEGNGEREFEVVFAADVTFDDRLLAPLVSTLHELAERYKEIEILIAATVRNEETLAKFRRACGSRQFKVEIIASTADEAYQQRQSQTGLFHDVETEIRIYRLWREGRSAGAEVCG